MTGETPGCLGSGHPEIMNQRPSYEVESSGIAGNSADAGAKGQTAAPAPHALPELAAARDPAGPHVLHHDLETRSTADLKAVGAVKYASDPTTEVTCLCYAVDDEPMQLWTRGAAVPAEFIEAARNPLWTISAHNDAFERSIARHILEVRHGFPAIPIERRRCSMAMAYAAALPGSLEKVVEVLGLPYPKDKAGQALMRRMSTPLPGGGWIEDAASLERLYAYCRRDVEAERAVYKALPPLAAEEQRLWEIDAVINDRGFAVDGELLEAAHRVITAAEAKLQAEFRGLTGLDSTNQVEKFVAWLAEHDCAVTDVRKGTLHHALRRKSLAPDVRRAIELRLQLAHASAAKIEALLAWRGTDNRVRGSLVFHGASTGRWVGRGPQPQNFKRDSAGIDAKIAAVLGGGAGLDSPVEAVGDVARALIIAAPGHRFFIGDFSGIESRILASISGQLSKLEQWAKYDQTGALNDDPYYLLGRACGLAEDIARAKGKICDLAFGFQGGLGAWKAQAPDDDPSTDEDIKRPKKCALRASQ
jgi:DNA polymerase bacteriophage-type